jgi:hypothetical protein
MLLHNTIWTMAVTSLIAVCYMHVVQNNQNAKCRQLLSFDEYERVICIDDSSDVCTVSYNLTNRFEHPISITGVSVSCRCLNVSYSKDSIAPGKTSTITVSFNPQDYNKLIARKIVVYSSLSESSYSAILKLTVQKEE